MIEGSCHCGDVRWSFEGVPDSATACNCTVCRRYGVLWAYDYENEGIRVSGPTHAYARAADHFAKAGRAVQPAPVALRAQAESEDHGQRRPA